VSAIDENHLHADPAIEAQPHAGATGAPMPPLQREPARTIFQKGAPGRRAFMCPDMDVPNVDVSELLPERFRRS
jgi:glycine dehydrogenase subunit 2